MRWRTSRKSRNIEDRRGLKAKPAAVGGGLGMLGLLLVVWLLGGDPGQVLQMMGGSGGPAVSSGTVETGIPDDEAGQFLAAVLADTEDVWNDMFARAEQRYNEPTLVLFTGAVQSACGYAQAAMGPFYCPRDSKVYLDFSFFKDMAARMGARGDFAQAYVVAHEVGHHVQNELGILPKAHQAMQRSSKTEANAISVRLELQADCLAGVWAHQAERTRQILEPGDYEEAITAASAVGDDRLQKQSQGYVVPDSFTHGSSQQRKRWFAAGFHHGDPDQCDTFSGASP